MSHKAPAALVDAYGQLIATPLCRATFYDRDGNAIQTLPVSSGRYRDRADVWPRVEATIDVAPGSDPSSTRPPVSPYGGTVVLTIGAVVGGRELSFQLATLDVVETTVERPSGIVSTRAVSREARVNEDRYTTRDATPAGLSSAVVAGIVSRTLPGVLVSNRLTNDPTLAVGAYPLDGDVWPTVEQIMDAADAEALFDASGSLILRPAPVRGDDVLTFRTGETGPGSLTGYQSTRGWAYNGVCVIYRESSGSAPKEVRGLWQDTTSASGVGTKYGRHTRVERVMVDPNKLPTQAAANAAAAALGKRRQDGYRSVELRAIPAPWITPGDTIRVEFLGGGSERLIVVGVEFPLDQLDVMTIDARDPSYTAT